MQGDRDCGRGCVPVFARGEEGPGMAASAVLGEAEGLVNAALKKPLKHRKCRVCKTVFQPDRPMQPYCGPGCALTFVRKTRAKAEKRERRAALKRLRTRRDWLKLCQQAF